MNPRNVGNFLRSKFGLFLVFVVVLFSGLAIYGRQQANQRMAAKVAAQDAKKPELGQVRMPLDKGLESGMPQEARTTGEAAGDGIVPFRPASAVAKATPKVAGGSDARPAPPHKIRYASLLAAYEAPQKKDEDEKSKAPERFMPFGTLLKCKLVNTIDSANLETPVIAVLLEDVWQNGKKVIPANTLVHGTARAGRIRDRVTATGTWRFVWQDGRELAFNGVALDREYEHEIDGYGITDGSAGIKGRVMAADNLQEIKMLASAALSGFARGTQDRTQTAYGTSITGSVSNGAREGVGEVFDLYAQRTLRDIEENGYFVRVAAGKEFYVYVLAAVDPHQASIAGIKAAVADEKASVPGQSPQNPNKG